MFLKVNGTMSKLNHIKCDYLYSQLINSFSLGYVDLFYSFNICNVGTALKRKYGNAPKRLAIFQRIKTHFKDSC